MSYFLNDRGDYYRRCSNCGSKYFDDAGNCEVCHGDPYFTDEWYADEEDTAPVELPAHWAWLNDVPEYQPARRPLLAGARNLIALIVVFIVGLFRWKSDQSDQIPF